MATERVCMLFPHFRKRIVWTTCCLRTETRRWPPSGTPFRDGQILCWGHSDCSLLVQTNYCTFYLSPKYIFACSWSDKRALPAPVLSTCFRLASFLSIPCLLISPTKLTFVLHVMTVTAVQTASLSGRLSDQRPVGCSQLASSPYIDRYNVNWFISEQIINNQ